ncbi:AHL_G0025980.mRNA.1.CDS.1 [Saccharomyces cerevisiae]|nr:Sln1p [Saccharomyces cerevisiae YJM1078]AJR37349.1 Sln1p [Saccharomyces cerevisiae YJM248]AJR45162.1 Sln1p [Saccharomyces cerevisiae YJM1252]CAI4378764.1 CPG_1a_G0025990.mRNA.1.CDS.1 [Saccharomyces cerevisiae]CAI4390623.1 AIE_G0026000.mRNA.1.CDS.1 [Saccharomyces cerevisiae]
MRFGLPSKLELTPPFRIGIRTQLTALVSIVALGSLIILAVTTGVYFTSNYKNLRSDRLYIAAQLKSSQIDQTLNYLYYQAYYLASRDALQSSLTSYVAGNKSADNWVDSLSVIQKFLSSSNLFYVAKVYDSSFNAVLNATNNGTGDLIPEDVLDSLFPLSTDTPLPSSLETIGILTDPVLNSTDYLMSMSLPIFANPSIILTDSRVYGYITIIMSAEGLKSVFNDTTALEHSTIAIISAVYNSQGKASGYHFVFPPYGSRSDLPQKVFSIKNDTFISSAFRNGKGGSLKQTNILSTRNTALGYSPCSFNLVNWVAIVSQPESVFLSPATKLAKIITGTVVAIGVFVILLTLPLAHWAVQPIVRLQKATELITEGRGLRPSTPRTISRASSFKRGFSSGFAVPSSLLQFNTAEAGSTTSVSGHGGSGHGSGAAFSANSSMKSAINLGNEKMSPPEEENKIPNNHTDAKISMDGSLNHDLLGPHSLRHNDTDRSSNRSHILTTSANLTEARLPDYRRLFSDELSDLTETFNTMTDALDQHYALLEERVRARTKQLEAAKIEAEAANEAKTVFIANISHELRTPLNGILGMTAISMEETDVNKIRNSLKLIFRSGELLLHILTELLTFSKNVLQRTKLEKRDFCITDVALQIKSIFGKVAKDQRVRLSISLFPNLIRTMVLWGDSNRIIQIVMNLVSNALKFTPVDGTVDVRMKLLGEYDKELSEKKQYKEVYIKKGTEVTENLETTDKYDLPTLSNHRKSVDLESSATSLGSNRDTSTIQEEITKRNTVANESIYKKVNDREKASNDDVSSIVSTTTSSYDNAIFNSQFNKAPGSDDEEGGNLGRPIENPKTWVISIEVEDTGPGIDPSLQESVFHPFVQGDQTLSRQYGGTGLGLSICRQLANMMHGTMKLESKVGVGSRFTFTLPLNQTKEISFADMEFPFEDEFNPESRKNRRVKFSVAKSIKSRQSTSSVATLATNRSSLTNDVLPEVRSKGKHETKDVGNPNMGREEKNDNGGLEQLQEKNIKPSICLTGAEVNEQNSLSSKHRSRHEGLGSVNLDRPFLQSTGTATSSRNIPTVKDDDKNETSVKILVVEDNHVNQEVIKRMLNLEGIENIELACDGQEAFDKVKELTSKGENYNMIFMDVQMPKVDGLLSTKMIRRDLGYTSPIVALTAFADDSNIKECLESGMNGFLSKPIKRPKLKTILTEFCAAYQGKKNNK